MQPRREFTLASLAISIFLPACSSEPTTAQTKSTHKHQKVIKVPGEFGDDETHAEIAALQSVEGRSAVLAPAAAAQSASPGYTEKVLQRVRPNIIWSGDTSGLQTVMSLRCSPTGALRSVYVIRSSGNQAWDDAALRAVQRSDPMPQDIDGKTPGSFMLTLRPASQDSEDAR